MTAASSVACGDLLIGTLASCSWNSVESRLELLGIAVDLLKSSHSWYNISMKIKKPIPAGGPVGATTGGATIADRFKLDLTNPAEAKGPTVGKKETTFAFAAGLLALAVAGLLTYILYQHWVSLMPA